MKLRIKASAYDFPCEGDLRPDNTAVIVIDMQLDFCGVGGMSTTRVKQFRSRLGGAGVGDESPLGRILIRGEPGHAIIPELPPQPGDPIIDKVGSGCFYGTEMEHLLRN